MQTTDGEEDPDKDQEQKNGPFIYPNLRKPGTESEVGCNFL